MEPVMADEIQPGVCPTCGDRAYYDSGISPDDGALCWRCLDRDRAYQTPVGSSPWVGVELEVELPRESYRNVVVGNAVRRYLPHVPLGITEDVSLSYGVEIRTPPIAYPAILTIGWDRLCTLLDTRYSALSHNTQTCGLHVHLSKNWIPEPFGANYWSRVEAFIVAHRKEAERVARRTETQYCRYIKKPIKMYGDGHTRYQAIRTLTDCGTVEFRLFKGTLRATTICASIAFAVAVAEFCGVEARTMFRAIRTRWYRFCEFVQANDRRYPGLWEYLQQQDVWSEKPVVTRRAPKEEIVCA